MLGLEDDAFLLAFGNFSGAFAVKPCDESVPGIFTYFHEPESINSLVLGDGKPPTFDDGNPYFMGPYKPLRTWVYVSHPILYGNTWRIIPVSK